MRLGRQARGPSSGNVVSRTKPVGSGVCFISVRGETPVPSSSAPHYPPASGWLVGRLFFSASRTGSSSGAPDDVLGGGGGSGQAPQDHAGHIRWVIEERGQECLLWAPWPHQSTCVFVFYADIVNCDLKSTLRVLYNLFTKYRNVE